MSFKDDVMDDLDTVLFDNEELAEYHNIDGRDILVVLTDVTESDAHMSYGLMKATLNPKEKAISKHSYHLFIRDKDSKRKYTTNAQIIVDKQVMFVQSAKHAGGHWQLVVGKSTV